MSKITRGWDEDRRAKQAENCRNAKPWTKSTGPKTPEGKKKVRDNAMKHGMRSIEAEELRRLLHIQQQMVTAIMNKARHPRGECH